MENAMEGGNWCNICSKMVNPMIEGENKCPICGIEFTEVMGSRRDHNDAIDLRSASVFSLYAPIFLGLMSVLSPSLVSIASQEYSSSSIGSREEEEVEPEREHELALRTRRRNSTSLMLVFGRLRDRMMPESENPENNRNLNVNVIVIDPFNEEALILRGPSHSNHIRSSSENPVGSLGDFLVGPGFDLLLQRLAQNDPNRYVYVNPPAQKAAIEAMPSVTIEENLQCTVCLEDIEIGSQVKDMPCKHKFHCDCILSWLKLHSSCPVCRFQMPSDDSNIENNFEHRIERIEGNQNNDQVRASEERMRDGRRNWLSILQPFDNFLPSP